MTPPPTTRKRSSSRTAAKAPGGVAKEAASALTVLEQSASRQFRADMQERYGIVTENALGVPMSRIKALAKTTGRSKEAAHRHALAEALWKTGVYEARTMAAFIDDPSLVTPAQMDRWRRDFDNWAIVDTVCFHFFDKTPHAYKKVAQWSRLRGEFDRRAAFALLASLALHDKDAADGTFLELLPLIDAAASDGRNFVKKSVSWALRAIGGRSPKLRASTRKLASTLAASDDPPRRWVGKDALKKLK